MHVIRLTATINCEEKLTDEELKYTVYELDRVLQEMWSERAQTWLLYSPVEVIDARRDHYFLIRS